MSNRKPAKRDDITWDDIYEKFSFMNNMSCRPRSLTKVSHDHIFDENKSVKWNREQVEKNNQEYHDEVARLNTEKNKARDAIYESIYEMIQDDVGHGLSRKKAQAIWNLAYAQGHAFGFYNILSRLFDLMKLANALLRSDE